MVVYDSIGNNGRLGNQLFQIASTIGIALSNNTKFYFNKAAIFDFLPNLKECFIEDENFRSDFLYRENEFCYQEIKLQENTKTTLFGYFQSEKYFEKHKEYIKFYLKIKNDLFTNYVNIYKNMNICSIHVRRGDYVSIGQTHPLNPHPLQSLEYYKEAIKIINADKYLVFSDDINWCKENFIGDNYIFVDNKISSLENDIFEMQLMSTCKNNIIANSSYSWWAAYFNENKDKKVIAPKLWFGKDYIKTITSHDDVIQSIIPKDWIII